MKERTKVVNSEGATTERTSSVKAGPANKPDPDDAITLKLHGDLGSDSAPDLQGVLHAVVLFQPVHLAVDLSDVRRVSREALRMIDRVGDAIGTWTVLDPSSSACADLICLGRSDLVDSESDLLANTRRDRRSKEI